MNHIVPKVNWTIHLSQILKKAEDGDTVFVDTETKKKLAFRAAKRLKVDVKVVIQ